jgi:hypothetical protein
MKKQIKDKRKDISWWILFLVGINTLMLAIVIIDKPIIIIEERNQTCNADKIIDNSFMCNDGFCNASYTNFYLKNNNDSYCYSVPSEPKCNYIKLKNGTKIPKGSCIMTFNYVIKCINASEVEGEVTE